MQIAEQQIVEKIRTLTEEEQEDVLRYVNGVLSNHRPEPTLAAKLLALSSRVPDEAWEKVPIDGAEQHDHYIYGTRKR